MNAEQFDPNDPLEARLHAMRPAEMPAELAECLARAKPGRIHWLAYAAPLAAAAVWLVASLLASRETANDVETARASDLPKPSDLRVYIPVEEKSTLVDVEDLGLLETIPARPVRIMRYTWIDDTTFRGDDGHSTLRRTKPREQFVPVVLQVY
jgi:hypothetical protein